jgi:hypothetical protein
MTKNELIDAYVRGDVDRRGFIRKLTAMGVSATAAAAYATSFGHDALAAPARNGAGFVARAQIEEDYGVGVIIEDLLEAVQSFLSLIADILNILDQLLSLGSGGLSQALSFQGATADPTQHPDWQYLDEIRAQIAEQQDAIVAQLGPSYGVTAQTSTQQASGSADELVSALADQMNTVAGVAAALIPSFPDAADVQLMTNIGIVNGRHAAIVNSIAGNNPSPSAFETPIDPSTV